MKDISQAKKRTAHVTVQLLSRVLILCNPMDCSTPGFPVHHSWSLLKPMSLESVLPSIHLILCCPFLLLPSIFPSIPFQMNQLFLSSGRSIGASTSICPLYIQDLFPLEWTGLLSLKSKELSRVFCNTTIQKHQFFGAQLFLWSNSHIHT